MGTNYLNIDAADDIKDKVRQDLKFRTGKFVWKVVFNIPLNPATVNNNNLVVVDSNNAPLATKISYNEDTNAIEIEPKEAYAQGETYTLHIKKTVESRGGQQLKKDIDVDFTV